MFEIMSGITLGGAAFFVFIKIKEALAAKCATRVMRNDGRVVTWEPEES